MTTETAPIRITSTKHKNKHGDTRGLHTNSLANLKPIPWVKGQSGNPAGHPITDRAIKKLPEVCPFDAQGRPWSEALTESFLRQALTRTDGMKEFLDRTEGKVPGDQPPIRDVNVVFIIGKGYQDVPQLTKGEDGTESNT